jgi:hypothetical protein
MQSHLLAFEGPDGDARDGGIATRIMGLARALAETGYDTHLRCIADPDLPGQPPPFLYQHVLLPTLRQGERVVILAVERTAVEGASVACLVPWKD